jgi:hypothetical protein
MQDIRFQAASYVYFIGIRGIIPPEDFGFTQIYALQLTKTAHLHGYQPLYAAHRCEGVSR